MPTPTAISSRCASCRCGTSNSRSRRSAATPARGAHAVCFSEIPPHLGLPSIHTGYWDPLFAVCEETRTTRLHAHRVVVEDAGRVARRAADDRDNAGVLQLDGVARRLPVLGRARAVPATEARVLRGPDRLDPVRARTGRQRVGVPRGWTGTKNTIPERPSSYYRGRIFGCFTTDLHGIASIEQVGEDNICFETDYPHTDTTWPFAREEAARITADAHGRAALQGLARQRDPDARARSRLRPVRLARPCQRCCSARTTSAAMASWPVRFG